MVFTARRRAMWLLSASEPAAASLLNVNVQEPYVHFSGSLKATFSSLSRNSPDKKNDAICCNIPVTDWCLDEPDSRRSFRRA